MGSQHDAGDRPTHRRLGERRFGFRHRAQRHVQVGAGAADILRPRGFHQQRLALNRRPIARVGGKELVFAALALFRRSPRPRTAPAGASSPPSCCRAPFGLRRWLPPPRALLVPRAGNDTLQRRLLFRDDGPGGCEPRDVLGILQREENGRLLDTLSLPDEERPDLPGNFGADTDFFRARLNPARRRDRRDMRPIVAALPVLRGRDGDGGDAEASRVRARPTSVVNTPVPRSSTRLRRKFISFLD